MQNLPAGQVAFTIILAFVLLTMACYFGWRQVMALRSLRSPSETPAEDRLYIRQQAYRRLICSVLMFVLACLLAGSLAIEGQMQELVDRGEKNRERNEVRALNPEEQKFFDRWRIFWAVTLLLLLGIMLLAAIDFFAIRRYSLRQFRQIQADHKLLIEGEIARIRSQRNGHT